MFIFLVRTAYADVDIGAIFGPAVSFPTFGTFLNVLLPNILTVSGVIAFLLVVTSGIKVIANAGAGEAEKAARDKAAFTAAIVGLMIIFGAYFLIQIVSTLVGYNFLNPPI